jgi:hypothetical protein
MTALEWFGLLIVVGYVTAMAWILQRGGALWRAQAFHLDCPRTHAGVECQAFQNVRTGQWLTVERCSKFADPAQVTCGRDCLRVVNLGLQKPSVAAS